MNPVLRNPRSLSSIPEGNRVRIFDIQGGRGVRLRLREMGLSPGDEIDVVRNGGGPMIVLNGTLRIALGKGVSSKILVE
ncbi:MAG: FeoA family protein [Candidatus Thermoplasmatota archaeon]|nr:FeoA family protein [Candidatus Thermoplasmatota archaeon]